MGNRGVDDCGRMSCPPASSQRTADTGEGSWPSTHSSLSRNFRILSGGSEGGRERGREGGGERDRGREEGRERGIEGGREGGVDSR